MLARFELDIWCLLPVPVPVPGAGAGAGNVTASN